MVAPLLEIIGRCFSCSSCSGCVGQFFVDEVGLSFLALRHFGGKQEDAVLCRGTLSGLAQVGFFHYPVPEPVILNVARKLSGQRDSSLRLRMTGLRSE